MNKLFIAACENNHKILVNRMIEEKAINNKDYILFRSIFSYEEVYLMNTNYSHQGRNRVILYNTREKHAEIIKLLKGYLR